MSPVTVIILKIKLEREMFLTRHMREGQHLRGDVELLQLNEKLHRNTLLLLSVSLSFFSKP